ncbi:MAG: hypothetical protein ACR2P5_03705 [Gammaproteobacteria bacterium]
MGCILAASRRLSAVAAKLDANRQPPNSFLPAVIPAKAGIPCRLRRLNVSRRPDLSGGKIP